MTGRFCDTEHYQPLQIQDSREISRIVPPRDVGVHAAAADVLSDLIYDQHITAIKFEPGQLCLGEGLQPRIHLQNVIAPTGLDPADPVVGILDYAHTESHLPSRHKKLRHLWYVLRETI